MTGYGHAVVVGGSVAGLLAAGAAAKSFDRVSVIERDELPAGPVPRRGVPQGSQLHVLLPIGLSRMEEVFPGIGHDLVAAGCVPYDEMADIPFVGAAGWRLRIESVWSQGLAFRRPLLEWVIRERLRRVPNVTIRQAVAAGFVLTKTGTRVAGVRLTGSTEPLAADLVIDAAGRQSKAGRWLEDLGFPGPPVSEVRVHLGYATQFVRVPDGLLDHAVKGVIAAPCPSRPEGAMLLPADNGVHSLTAVGMMRAYPPGDRDGFLDFLDRAPTPLLGEVARRAEPCGEIRTYRMPGNLRRRWEDFDDRPGGFAVVGDAAASLNPLYGQGMTMAATAAACFQETLSRSSGDLEVDVARFQESMREPMNTAFAMAAGGDALYAGAELRAFAAPSAEEALYSEKLEELATHDLETVRAIGEASFCMRPDILESEHVRATVEQWERSGRIVPEFDPARFPVEVHSLPVTRIAQSAGVGHD